jgi:hypothetical protein
MYRLPPRFADTPTSPAALFWKELYQVGKRQHNNVTDVGTLPIVVPDIREEVRLMEVIDLTGMAEDTFLQEFHRTGGGHVQQDRQYGYTIRLNYGAVPERGLIKEHGFARAWCRWGSGQR